MSAMCRAAGRRGTFAILVLLASASGCSSDARGRALVQVRSPKFWPDAPATTAARPAHPLAWNLDNLRAYTRDESFTYVITSGNHASGSVTTTLALALRFEPGAGPASRDMFVDRVDVKVDNGTTRGFHIGRDGVAIDTGFGMKPYEPGDAQPFALPNLDRPVGTFVVADNALVEDLDVATGGYENALRSSAWLALPRGPIEPDTTWTKDVNVRVAKGRAPFAATITYVYLGAAKCPSNDDKQCAVIEFSAAGNATLNHGVTIEGGWAGKLYFDVDAGIIDESRTLVDVEYTGGPKASVGVRGTMRLRVAAPRAGS